MIVSGSGIYETMLALSLAWMWIFGVAEPALAFTSAEVQLLFPAPVTRHALIRYKLVQTQIAIAINVAIWLLLLSRNALIPPLLKAFSLWVLFTTLYLHRVGASFVRVSGAQRGLTGLRKNALPLAVAAAAILGVGWEVLRALPSLGASLNDGTFTTALAGLRQAPAVRIVLWPIHAIVGPVFARDVAAWQGMVGWSLLLLGVNYLWVIRTGVAFEEAAMQRSERIAAQRAARQSRSGAKVRSSRAWFPLPVSARPVTAIIWKNATALQRLVPLGRVLAVTLAIVIAIVALLPSIGAGWSAEMAWSILRTIGLILAGVFVMLGPLYIRTDLQQDMLVLPLLKSYPLSGAAVVAAEIASSVVILSSFQAVFLLVGFPKLIELVGGERSAADRRCRPLRDPRHHGAPRGGRERLGGGAPGMDPPRVGAGRGDRGARTERRVDPRLLHRASRPAHPAGGLRAAGGVCRAELARCMGDRAGGGRRRGGRDARALAGGEMARRRAVAHRPRRRRSRDGELNRCSGQIGLEMGSRSRPEC